MKQELTELFSDPNWYIKQPNQLPGTMRDIPYALGVAKVMCNIRTQAFLADQAMHAKFTQMATGYKENIIKAFENVELKKMSEFLMDASMTMCGSIFKDYHYGRVNGDRIHYIDAVQFNEMEFKETLTEFNLTRLSPSFKDGGKFTIATAYIAGALGMPYAVLGNFLNNADKCVHTTPNLGSGEVSKVDIHGPVLWNVLAMIWQEDANAEVYQVEDQLYVHAKSKVDLTKYLGELSDMGGTKYELQGSTLKVRVAPVEHVIDLFASDLKFAKIPLEMMSTRLSQVLSMVNHFQVPIGSLLELSKILDSVQIDHRYAIYYGKTYKNTDYELLGAVKPTDQVWQKMHDIEVKISHWLADDNFKTALRDRVLSYSRKIAQYEQQLSSALLLYSDRIVRGMDENIPGWT
jgi:hypothetical protein